MKYELYDNIIRLIENFDGTIINNIENDYRTQFGIAGSLKWIWRSSLQKAVRRGQVGLAQRLAGLLLNLDERYLFRTLAIIAVEDVGRLDLIGFTLSLTRQNFRSLAADRLGPIADIVPIIVSLLCVGAKTRMCCELSLSLDMAGPSHSSWKKASELNVASLITALQTDSIFDAYAAMCVLRRKGPTFLKPRAPENRASIMEMVDAACEQKFAGQTPLILAVVKLCVSSPLDTMHLAVWPIASRKAGDEDQQVPDDLPVSREILGVAAEALDMHTREGQEAIRRFYWVLRSIPAYASLTSRISAHKCVGALGALVFVEEGGLLNNRLRSCWLDALRQLQDTVFCEAKGVPAFAIRDFREIVRAELPRLHDLREEVLMAARGKDGPCL